MTRRWTPTRLEKSLRILRDVTAARLIRAPELIQKHEAILRQHDYDSRDRVDPRQLNIFEAGNSSAKS
jgi:hypothetical protein